MKGERIKKFQFELGIGYSVAYFPNVTCGINFD